MPYSEIYRILSFEKTKLINKSIMSAKNNLIIVIGSAKQRGAQLFYFKKTTHLQKEMFFRFFKP
jgi:nicotinamide mononucleotide adenylyltransferase